MEIVMYAQFVTIFRYSVEMCFDLQNWLRTNVNMQNESANSVNYLVAIVLVKYVTKFCRYLKSKCA